MYIITCLGIVKLYQNRHPDIAANAHTVYTGFAAIILIAVMGVVSRSLHHYTLLSIFYFLVLKNKRDNKECGRGGLDII